MVGHHAVDLLGHASIEASEPSLNVAEANAALRRRERTGEGRVRVAIHEHGVGLLGLQDGLQCEQHSPCLLSVAPAATPSACSGRGRPSSTKKEPAVRSSQCWPVSTKTSWCRARSAGRSGDALMSCGRVPTTLTIFTWSLGPSGSQPPLGGPGPPRGGTPTPRTATPSPKARSRKLFRPSRKASRLGNQAGSSLRNAISRLLGNRRASLTVPQLDGAAAGADLCRRQHRIPRGHPRPRRRANA